MSNFDSTKIPLPDVISSIMSGKIQLPDFQRGWIWDEDHIKSLLVSVARSFPVGAVMMLDTGGEIDFQVRPIEGISFSGSNPEPSKLILDGQQRLTSLTSVLALNSAVPTTDSRHRKIHRHYYIDIKLALEDDRLEEAFVSIPEDRKLKTNFDRDIVLDLSTRELECENFYFPCSQILNSDDWEQELFEYFPDRMGQFMQFRKTVLQAFRAYQLPVITLDRATSKEAVCLVFEKVNTGGVALTVFELVTAMFAAEGFNLRDDWYGSSEREVEGRSERLVKINVLEGIEPTDFLQAISLRKSFDRKQLDLMQGKKGKMVSPVSAKRVTVLSLELQDYQDYADDVERGFKFVELFLRKQCIFAKREVPYRTQIIPLAAVLSLIKERWLEPRIYECLSRWFWCGVLGELYGGAVETRIANDFEELLGWFQTDQNGIPRTISDASFQESRLDTLRSRNSAAYKGLNALILREGAEDFFWKESIRELSYVEISLDIHHIFPKAWCEEKEINRKHYDSVVNKTPISYKANRMIGRKAPSEYIKKIQTHDQVNLNDESFDRILISHRIEPMNLRSDDFFSFYKERKRSLLILIEDVMKKRPQFDQSTNSEFADFENNSEQTAQDFQL